MGKQFIGGLKLLWNDLLFTLSSMGGVVCSAIVSELLKMRKSLAIHYWWDVPSDVELNNNVINVKKIWGVWTSFVICTIFRFNTIFSIYEKKNLAKIWEGGWWSSIPSASPGFYGPACFIKSLINLYFAGILIEGTCSHPRSLCINHWYSFKTV